MSSFAYGRLTRERERYSPTDGALLQDTVRMSLAGSPPDEITKRLERVGRDAAGKDGGAAERVTKPAVGSYVDAMVAIVPAEALAFFAAATTFAGLVTTETTEIDGTPTSIETVANVNGAVWLIVLSMVCSVALFVIGKFGSKWAPLDYVRALIPAAAFFLWLILQERSMYWMLWDRSKELPGFGWFDDFAWNAYIVKISAVFAAVLLPLLAGALGIRAEEQEPETKPKKDGKNGRNAGGDQGGGGAPEGQGGVSGASKPNTQAPTSTEDVDEAA